MAQADLNVANQSGSAFRADLNNQLLALGTLMSGASEPSTTYAYMLWADTANGQLKQRNAANSGWVVLGALATANLGLAALASPTFTGTVTIPTLSVTGTAGVPLGSAGAPTYTFSGDPNTGVYSPGADQVAISTAGTGRLFVNSTGRIGAGTDSPTSEFDIFQNAASDTVLTVRNTTGTCWPAYLTGSGDMLFGLQTSGSLQVRTSNTERLRIDSSGRLLVGTSSAYGNNYLQIQGDVGSSAGIGAISLRRGVAPSVMGEGALEGIIDFGPNDGGVGARIAAIADAQQGTNDYPSRLVFSTTADGASSPTERVRISNGGDTSINTGGTAVNVASGTTDGATFFAQGASSGILQASSSDQICVYLRRRTSDGSIIQFRRDTTTVGSIDVTATAASYVTSSDYRLKENVTPVTDGITRLQQLKPSRFNFIADPDKTVDGFLAHEVQTVVPEAITGEKDAVDDDGNPIYQGIDQSKLVPLLTAALQEAIGRIEQLEARLTDAGL